jgi:hypothetical protein
MQKSAQVRSTLHKVEPDRSLFVSEKLVNPVSRLSRALHTPSSIQTSLLLSCQHPISLSGTRSKGLFALQISLDHGLHRPLIPTSFDDA